MDVSITVDIKTTELAISTVAELLVCSDGLHVELHMTLLFVLLCHF